jgi:hypothetical protein
MVKVILSKNVFVIHSVRLCAAKLRLLLLPTSFSAFSKATISSQVEAKGSGIFLNKKRESERE